MAPPIGFVTIPTSPLPKPFRTPFTASLVSSAFCMFLIGWSTIPATAPRRLTPNPLRAFEKPIMEYMIGQRMKGVDDQNAKSKTVKKLY